MLRFWIPALALMIGAGTAHADKVVLAVGVGEHHDDSRVVVVAHHHHHHHHYYRHDDDRDYHHDH